MKNVVIIGGGVGGMTAAHELIDRGYDVTVLERRHIPGGKARSVDAEDTGIVPAPPGEHGFRFFPSFYRHVTDTMSRIPFPAVPSSETPDADDQKNHTVEANLVPVHRAAVLHADREPLIFPLTRDDGFYRLMWRDLFQNGLKIPRRDWLHFAWLMLRLQSACDRRRFEVYEETSWWDFSDAEHRSEAYRDYLADGLTRTLVAAKSREMSARTGGYILLQLMKAPARHGSVDRVLNGPTNDQWIDPWLHLLRQKGVDYRIHHNVIALETEDDAGKKVTGVTFTVRKGETDEEAMSERTVETYTLHADKVIVAVPKEVMSEFVTPEIKRTAPIFGHLDDLKSRWMNGVIFYVRADVPIVEGHVIYLDSPWALTSISQRQFWTGDQSAFDDDIGGIISVDVSAWDAVGLNGKTAQNCTTDEIIDEVWNQLSAHVNSDENKGLAGTLERSNLLGAFVDTDITHISIDATEIHDGTITSAAAHAAADAAADVVDSTAATTDAPATSTPAPPSTIAQDPAAEDPAAEDPAAAAAEASKSTTSPAIQSAGKSAKETNPIPSSNVVVTHGTTPGMESITFNAEPLLINTTGSWYMRPTADTAVEDLYLASDYVQTHIDLATMEGANEAARRAVNAILDDDDSTESRCGVWPLHEPKIFGPLKAIDRVRFRLTHGSKRSAAKLRRDTP